MDNEKLIYDKAKAYGVPVVRTESHKLLKELINELNERIPGFKRNIFGALNNAEQLFIWDKNLIK